MVLAGDLDGARASADQSFDLAERSENLWQRMDSRCRRATVAHMQEERDLAERLFQEAISIQREAEPLRPVLYADRGFRFHQFHWERISDKERHRYADLLVEAQSALDIDHRHDPLTHWWVAVGLDYLSEACATGGKAKPESKLVQNARHKFNEAYDTLVSSGSVIYLPEFFISKSRFNLHMGFNGDALDDAEQALWYAREYRMPLAQADSLLLKAFT